MGEENPEYGEGSQKEELAPLGCEYEIGEPLIMNWSSPTAPKNHFFRIFWRHSNPH